MSSSPPASSDSFVLYDQSVDMYEQLYFTDAKLDLERPFLDRLLELLPESPRILDLGCGPAREAQYLIDRGARYTGVDASPMMIAAARRHTPQATFMQMDMRILDLPLNAFDAVIALDSLIHFPKNETLGILKNVCRSLTDKGALMLAVESGQGEHVEPFGLGIDRTVMVSLYTPKEMEELLHALGFELVFQSTRALMEGEFPFPQLYVIAVSAHCRP